ncbi:uncharacterized protein LOC135157067 [Lytechinus pictus]|uniref:uncharacterized protein LOC135157067 n=1 Tax=Lytechinus pictus TaxID=7653 RepID=UPI0030B9CD78
MRTDMQVRICLVCFDVGHCIPKWGRDFRPAYKQTCGVVTLFGEVPTRHRALDMFHSNISHDRSSDIIDNFRIRGSCTRMVVTTLALGLGVDIEDINLVVNWGAEDALTYWRQIGQCA